MTTKKLYLNNSYLREFTCNIITAIPYPENTNQYILQLDQTAFYPEGGGQPSDTGYLGESFVSYVYEEEGIVYHVVDQVPQVQNEITGKIDWERRFDHMQQHLGQHLLSSVFEKELNANTIGFHLGKEFVTIDLDRPSLTFEEAYRIEAQANQLVTSNLEVKLHYPTPQELKSFPLRKAPTVEEDIRIVEVSNYDFSPCGGTHPQFTGNVGMIKIRKWEKLRDGIRLEFLCGMRALADYQRKNTQINHLASLLSIKDIEVQEAIERLLDENKTLFKGYNQQKRTLLEYRAKDLYNAAEEFKSLKIIAQKFDGEDFKDLQALAALLNQMPNTIALLATVNEKAQVVFTRSKELDMNMNQLFKEVIPLIDGKGGGNPITAQGGGSLVSNLEGLLMAAVNKLKHEYIKEQKHFMR